MGDRTILFKRQVDRGGEFEYLITDDDGERRKLNSAMEEIDDWDEDEDLKELGGELDEETIMQVTVCHCHYHRHLHSPPPPPSSSSDSSPCSRAT